jgi:hypothetical protein
MASTPEAKVKNAVKKMLKEEFPQIWTNWPVSNGMGQHGVPDLIMCAGGKFFGIEVKAKGKKVTLLQALQLQHIEQAGGVAMAIAGEEDIDKLRTMLLCMHLPKTPGAIKIDTIGTTDDLGEALGYRYLTYNTDGSIEVEG